MEISAIGRNNAAVPVETPVKLQEQAMFPEVVAAVRAVNKSELLGERKELMFSWDRGTHRPIVRIVDKDTREVLDQIPPESVLSLAEDWK